MKKASKMITRAIVIAKMLVILAVTANGADWTYENPSNWGKSAPACYLQSQSPINIYEGDVTPNAVNEQFVYKNYDTSNGLVMNLNNNGHTATVALSGTDLPEISGGGLGGTFVAAQFHFHWHIDDELGSEHLISSGGFACELHIVHYRKSYGELNNAADKFDGLAVLGFMFELVEEDNPNYASLAAALTQVTDAGSQPVRLAAATLNSYLPPSFGNFYRYKGSLTTPPCYQSVTWTVFKETIKISRNQLEYFKDLLSHNNEYIWNNVRPVQPLNGREVTSNFDSTIKWTYAPGNFDVAHWPDYFEACGDDSQSPVNIPSGAATQDNSLGEFTFTGFDAAPYTMKISNDGHTITVSLDGSVPTVSGGGLPEVYKVAQFHFHWGANSMRGSEHTVDAKMYPMEVHFVMYKQSLGTIGNALKEPEGLAVLGFFYEISNGDNTNLDPVVNMLNSVKNPNQETSMTAIALDTLMPADRSNYYRYPGSLTTPGCYESVIWTVFDSKLTISESQMAKFRAMVSSDKDELNRNLPMVDNYRPPQPLNNRVIRRNFAVAPKPKVHWTYHGQTGAQNWKNLVPLCGSTARQSPIDIQFSEAEFIKMPNFEYKNFNTRSGVAMELSNNGHAVTVTYQAGDLQVSGGGLEDNYRVAQFHFHWGSVNTQGSEHAFNGERYPMELHIVTYNLRYANVGLAMTQSNGLAVLGFMFEISDDDNVKLEPLLNKLGKVEKADTKVTLDAFALDSMLPKDKTEFFRYDGSLTTPTCDESVTWTVFYSTIPISQSQLNMFRNLQTDDLDERNNIRPLVDNYRPLQPLGQRKVYTNLFTSAAPTPIPTAVTTVMFTLGKLIWNSY